jgi:hypothetical protein
MSGSARASPERILSLSLPERTLPSILETLETASGELGWGLSQWDVMGVFNLITIP